MISITYIYIYEVHDHYKELFLHPSNSKIKCKRTLIWWNLVLANLACFRPSDNRDDAYKAWGMQNYQCVTWEKGAVAAGLPLPSSLPFYFPFLCFPNFFVGLEQAMANYFANPLALCHVQDPPYLRLIKEGGKTEPCVIYEMVLYFKKKNECIFLKLIINWYSHNKSINIYSNLFLKRYMSCQGVFNLIYSHYLQTPPLWVMVKLNRKRKTETNSFFSLSNNGHFTLELQD